MKSGRNGGRHTTNSLRCMTEFSKKPYKLYHRTVPEYGNNTLMRNTYQTGYAQAFINKIRSKRQFGPT